MGLKPGHFFRDRKWFNIKNPLLHNGLKNRVIGYVFGHFSRNVLVIYLQTWFVVLMPMSLQAGDIELHFWKNLTTRFTLSCSFFIWIWPKEDKLPFILFMLLDKTSLSHHWWMSSLWPEIRFVASFALIGRDKMLYRWRFYKVTWHPWKTGCLLSIYENKPI